MRPFANSPDIGSIPYVPVLFIPFRGYLDGIVNSRNAPKQEINECNVSTFYAEISPDIGSIPFIPVLFIPFRGYLDDILDSRDASKQEFNECNASIFYAEVSRIPIPSTRTSTGSAYPTTSYPQGNNVYPRPVVIERNPTPSTRAPTSTSYSTASYPQGNYVYTRPVVTNQSANVVNNRATQLITAGNVGYAQSEVVSTSKSTKEIEESISRAIVKARAAHVPWSDEEVIADELDVPIYVAQNVITLLNEGCTIPFIVRYRSNMIDDCNADEIREIQDAYEELKKVHKKVETILKTVKHEKFDEKAATSLLSAKTMDEVDLLYAPFKPENKKTLAEIARKLGLEPLAVQLLTLKTSREKINLSPYVKPNEGMKTEQDVLKGIQHIIADIISKNRDILDFLRQQAQREDITINSKQTAEAIEKDQEAEEEGRETESSKYQNYFDFKISLKNIAPHHILALNRGENQKILKVKVTLSGKIKKEITDFCWKTFFSTKSMGLPTSNFLKSCVDDSYSRLIEPHMCRQIRSDLLTVAGKESVSFFCSNVKSLLLTQPVRGKTIIGIDPGFYHGCKTAVVSPQGEVLDTAVLYPHSDRKWRSDDAEILQFLVSSYDATYIAIGNGTACRETETWLSNLITAGRFRPYDVKYCIINESGVSIWSVTKEAEEELPDLEPNLRSAVSIARRLQDPLLEYAKVMPKHLGVGMYQHDIAESQLNKGFDSVFEECASFVGVDINVCPKVLLSKVSGLSELSADRIVKWRERRGGFVCRDDLLNVLDQKTYQQCAGFVKILPQTCFCSSNLNPLDTTIIHPESYGIATRFLRVLRADSGEIGYQSLVKKVNSYMVFTSPENVAAIFDVETQVMKLIIDAFKQLQDYDYREEFERPLFQTNVRSFSDLSVGQELTGRICNLTTFGAFVDIGVGKDGLIHTSQMKGQKLSVGNRVTVRVKRIDHDRKQIGLELCTYW